MNKGEETKQAIVDQALELVSTIGLDKLTIGTLAGATGMSKSGLFAHFKSKEALQLHVLQEARDRYIEVVLRPRHLMTTPQRKHLPFQRSLTSKAGCRTVFIRR